MITELQLQNFRGFKDVTLKDLRRVNLLVGGNDTGKTSVLEALILLLGDNGQVAQLPSTYRSSQDERVHFWPWLAFDRDSKNAVRIQATDAFGQKIGVDSQPGDTLNLSRGIHTKREEYIFPLNPALGTIRSPQGFRTSQLSVQPSSPVEDAEKYNQIVLEKEGEARFEQIMREIEPRVKRLRYAKLPSTSLPLIFVDLGLSRAIPSTQMGQAFNRILHIYAEILTSKTDVLLIDEIENGIFSESLPLIWKGLLAICEQEDVQVFATTHSRECVMAAHAVACERSKDELCVQRLQIVNGNIEAVRLGAPHLEMAAEMGLEVRS